MPPLAIAAAVAAASALAAAKISSDAAGSAATKQANSAANSLQFQEQVWQQQQANQAPFLQAGQQSIAQIMAGINSGQFGPGSLLKPGDMPSLPTAPGQFTAPTLEEAQQTPGYQFTQQQGEKGIAQAAAAAGGAVSGGTLKAASQYNTNLADTTYNDVFQRALAGYGANLSDYAAQLSGFQVAQGAQQQEFNQLATPAAIGAGGANSLNLTGSSTANSVAGLMQAIGNAGAAGTVGAANAISGGVNAAGSGISNALIWQQLQGMLKGVQSPSNPNFSYYNNANPFTTPPSPTPYVLPEPPTPTGDIFGGSGDLAGGWTPG